jgi:hypothetical protein
MNTPLVEGVVPSFYIDVNYGSEAFRDDDGELLKSMIAGRWQQAVEYAPAAVAPAKPRLFKWLPRKSTKSVYQAGPLLVAITTTALAASRPVITPGAGAPVKPPVIVTHVLRDTPTRVALQGKGRDLHGIVPPGTASAVSGPRGRTVDDWDF